MFTDDASSFISLFLGKLSTLFSMTVPGTTVSFFELFAGCTITLFILRLIRTYINVVGGVGSSESVGLGHSEFKRGDKK